MSDEPAPDRVMFRRTVSARRLQDKEEIDGLFDKMVTLRDRVARNAGFADFVGYAF